MLQTTPFPLMFFYKLPEFIPNLNIELNTTPKPKPPPRGKRDPVMDTKEEINKWLAERRNRYPRKDRAPLDDKPKELSKLESKLRKKICLLSGSARRTQMKVKQMQDLCKTMTEGTKLRKPRVEDQPIQESDTASEVGEQQAGPIAEPKEEQMNSEQQGKETTIKEIKRLEKRLDVQKPKNFYKLAKEGQEVEKMPKNERRRIKSKLKQLKQTLMQNGEPTLPAPQKQVQLTNEEHTKEMIETLEGQQEKMSNLLVECLDYKINPANYKYKNNTLLTNLLIDEIYKERQYILQAIRYIVKENFFEKKQVHQQFESITSESECEEEGIISDNLSENPLLQDEDEMIF